MSPRLEMALLGARSGHQVFYVDRDFWLSSTTPGPHVIARLEVPVRPLREEMARHRPTFLIIDIEGGRAHRDLALDGVRKVLLELHPDRIGLERAQAVERFFAEAGFVASSREPGESVVFFERG